MHARRASSAAARRCSASSAPRGPRPGSLRVSGVDRERVSPERVARRQAGARDQEPSDPRRDHDRAEKEPRVPARARAGRERSHRIRDGAGRESRESRPYERRQSPDPARERPALTAAVRAQDGRQEKRRSPQRRDAGVSPGRASNSPDRQGVDGEHAGDPHTGAERRLRSRRLDGHPPGSDRLHEKKKHPPRRLAQPPHRAIILAGHPDPASKLPLVYTAEAR